MLIKMEVYSTQDKGNLLESYTVPDGSWIQTRTIGAQYAYAVSEKEITFRNKEGIVVCSPAEELPPIPPKLLKFVNGNDKKYGKNGFQWLGKNRDFQGGTTIDRVREYVATSQWFNPLNIDAVTLAELREKLLG